MFKGKKGQALAKDMTKRTKTFVPGAGLGAAAARPGAGGEAATAKPEPLRPDVEAIKVYAV